MMEWFVNMLGGTLGVGAAILAAVGACFLGVLLWRIGEGFVGILYNGAKALHRYAVRDEVITEWRSEADYARVTRYEQPKPFRVALARKGLPLPPQKENEA